MVSNLFQGKQLIYSKYQNIQQAQDLFNNCDYHVKVTVIIAGVKSNKGLCINQLVEIIAGKI